MPDGSSLGRVILEQRVYVADANPDPGPWVALVAFAQEYATAATGYGRENPRILKIKREAEYFHIEIKARRKITNPEDRRSALKGDRGCAWCRGFWCHIVPPLAVYRLHQIRQVHCPGGWMPMLAVILASP
jgi:hypothetical protein